MPPLSLQFLVSLQAASSRQIITLLFEALIQPQALLYNLAARCRGDLYAQHRCSAKFR